MLSLDECRHILGYDCDLSDDDLDKLRAQLCDLAVVTIAAFEGQKQANVWAEGGEGIENES